MDDRQLNPEVVEAVARVKDAIRAPRHYRVLRQSMAVVWQARDCEDWHQDVVALFREAGWWMGRIHHSSRARERWHRQRYKAGARGNLRLRLDTYPMGGKVHFYPDGNPSHRSGPYYAFDKWGNASSMDRRRFVLASRTFAVWLEERGCLDATEPEFESPYDRIEYKSRESWHYRGEASIWEPRRTEAYNDKDCDGRRIVNGEVRYCYDVRTRRLVRGQVFHNINNMWWMVCGGGLKVVASFDLFVPERVAGLPRRHTRPGTAHNRVLALMQRAVDAQDFERAIPLRDRLRVLRVLHQNGENR
jgi:hypothetical protein